MPVWREVVFEHVPIDAEGFVTRLDVLPPRGDEVFGQRRDIASAAIEIIPNSKSRIEFVKCTSPIVG